MTSDESVQLYQLFIWHAQGKRLVEKYCPNCGPMLHLEEPADGRKRYICMQCQCVSSDSTRKDHKHENE